jgi:protein-tyrosine-phosphatase
LAAQIYAGGLNKSLIFICTHNSRRSHYGQIWAAVASEYYNIPRQTFSGGTEATAFHPNAVESLRRAGFNIHSPSSENPKIEVGFAENKDPLICFSKKYDAPSNPSDSFVAIMTCDEANEACPVVSGADFKFSLTYSDPKISDGTEKESETYDERCFQIASEMFYLFNKIATHG